MKLNKKIFYILFLFLFVFSFFQNTNLSLAVSVWTEQTNSGQRDWTGVASSSDGVKLAAVVYGGYIYTSTDSGANWAEQTGSGQRDWRAIASSSNGTKLVAVVDNGYIYTSTDSGVNWTEQTDSGILSWKSVASSSDGVKLIAGGSNTYIYTSTDSGANWTEQTNSGQRSWLGVASSSDGVKLVAGDDNFAGGGYIYTSTDSGANWTEQTNSGQFNWESVASSSDGVKLAAVADDISSIYTSTDSGVNWTEQVNANMQSPHIASSSNGTVLVALSEGLSIYTSPDGGSTWIEQTISGTSIWNGIAISSDGTKASVVDFGGYIYTLDLDLDTPSVSSFNPADNYTEATVSQNLEIVFDEDIYVNEGSVIIYKSSDDSIFETIGIGSGQVTGDGTDTITVNPTNNFDNGTNYYVLIDSGVVWDFDHNQFTGISDEATWNFTTVSAPAGGGGGGGSTPDRACEDGLDNDGDGLVDYPEDPGCDSPTDRDEYNEIIVLPVYACSDGIDNDSDGLIDFPNDIGCESLNDDNEYNEIISPPIDPIDDEDPRIDPPEVNPCISNPSLCSPPPIDPCVVNSLLCNPLEEDPCILDPESCQNEELIEENTSPIQEENDFTSEDNCENPNSVLSVIWCSIVDSYDYTLDVFSGSFKEIDFILNNKDANLIVKAIGIVGLIFGAVFSVLPRLFASPFSFTEILMLPYRLWSALMSAFGLKKRARPWGTVYDAITKQPLDPVIVSLQDLEGNEIQTSITDMDGRYGFLVSPGMYRLLPKKTNYAFPSLKLVGKTRDELYLDLYFGNVFEVKGVGEVVIKNIPMDPIGFDWNEFAKRDQKLMKFYSNRDRILTKISDWFFSFGFTVSSIALITTPNTYNIGIFILYAILLFLRETGLKTKNLGRVTDTVGNPISFAILKVFNADTNTLISKKVANKYGNYYCLVQQGNYYVEIDQKLSDESYKTVFKSGIVGAKKGYINENFKISL